VNWGRVEKGVQDIFGKNGCEWGKRRKGLSAGRDVRKVNHKPLQSHALAIKGEEVERGRKKKQANKAAPNF